MNFSNLISLFSTPLGIHLVRLFYAVVLLAVVALVAKLVQVLVVWICGFVKLDIASDKTGIGSIIRRSGINNSLTNLLGDLSFWGVIIAGGVWIIYAFNFVRAIVLLRSTLKYISVNVVSAAFVFILSVVLANFISGLILFLGGLVFLPGYKLVARIIQYVVVIFGIVVGLDKLGIPASTLFRPDIILGFFALAGAIAFGLGCKDLAANFLSNFLNEKRK